MKNLTEPKMDAAEAHREFRQQNEYWRRAEQNRWNRVKRVRVMLERNSTKYLEYVAN